MNTAYTTRRRKRRMKIDPTRIVCDRVSCNPMLICFPGETIDPFSPYAKFIVLVHRADYYTDMED